MTQQPPILICTLLKLILNILRKKNYLMCIPFTAMLFKCLCVGGYSSSHPLFQGLQDYKRLGKRWSHWSMGSFNSKSYTVFSYQWNFRNNKAFLKCGDTSSQKLVQMVMFWNFLFLTPLNDSVITRICKLLYSRS